MFPTSIITVVAAVDNEAIRPYWDRFVSHGTALREVATRDRYVPNGLVAGKAAVNIRNKRVAQT